MSQSLAACAILSTFAILAQRKRQTSAVRAKQIVLACAIFDPDGRLLVSPEGILPRQKITSAYTVGVCACSLEATSGMLIVV